MLGPSKVPKERLNLSDTGLHDDDVRILIAALIRLRGRNLKIDELDLSRNAISDKGCEALCGLVTPDFDVKKINLSRNISITTDGLCTLIKGSIKNTKLASLDFEVCDINLEG